MKNCSVIERTHRFDVDSVDEHASALAAGCAVRHGEVCDGERERHEEHGLDGDELALPLPLEPGAGDAEHGDGLGEDVAEGGGAACDGDPPVGGASAAASGVGAEDEEGARGGDRGEVDERRAEAERPGLAGERGGEGDAGGGGGGNRRGVRLGAKEVGEQRGREEEVQQHDQQRRRAHEQQRRQHRHDEEGRLRPPPRPRPQPLAVHQRQWQLQLRLLHRGLRTADQRRVRVR